jgi:hypothetical protein
MEECRQVRGTELAPEHIGKAAGITVNRRNRNFQEVSPGPADKELS